MIGSPRHSIVPPLGATWHNVQTSVRTNVSRETESRRSVYFGPVHGEHNTPVLSRGLLNGTLRAGPLIVEEYEGTTVVPPNCAARLDDAGNIVIEVGGT